MTIQIDHKEKTLSLSVRDLVKCGNISKVGIESLFVPIQTLNFGKEVHTKIQAEKTSNGREYKSEVFVKFETQIDEWRVTIRGFIDLLKTEKNKFIVEEIKSFFNPRYIPTIDDLRLSSFKEQLKYYGYIISKTRDVTTVDLSLILENRYNNKRYQFNVPYEDCTELIKQKVYFILSEENVRQLRYERKIESLNNYNFPFVYRKFQKDIVEQIENVLNEQLDIVIEAPSGLGKTVVSLFPTLEETLKNRKKCFFLTSKTTQREGVSNTLQLFQNKQIYFLAVILKAKEKMCPNSLYFCHVDYCPYLKNYRRQYPEEFLKDVIEKGGVIEAKDIEEYSKLNKAFCPFEVMLDLSLEADIIVGDYNHVFDPNSYLQRFFSSSVSPQQQYYSIIDEAHNLLNRSLDYYSKSLSNSDLKNIFEIVKESKQYLMELPIPNSVLNKLSKLIRTFRIIYGFSSETIEVELTEKIFQSFKEIYSQYEYELSKYVQTMLLKDIIWYDDPYIDFYYKFRDFMTILNLVSKFPVFSLLFNSKEETLHILCKDSSSFLQKQYNFFSSIVFISATISPFFFFRETLGLPIDKTIFKQYPSPFPEGNRKIIIYPEVDTRYNERKKHLSRIVQIIKEVISINPGRYFVFLPSFSLLEEISKKISKITSLLVLEQQHEMTDEDREQYMRFIEANKNLVLLAVSGGIFSEGVDFPNLLSGTIVISPNLPSFSIERELMKEYYDRKFSNRGFDYAYKFPGLMKTFQAAGRLIRTPKDKGIILFIGERFSRSSYNSFFPRYWYKTNPRELIFTNPNVEIQKFWKQIRRLEN